MEENKGKYLIPISEDMDNKHLTKLKILQKLLFIPNFDVTCCLPLLVTMTLFITLKPRTGNPNVT